MKILLPLALSCLVLCHLSAKDIPTINTVEKIPKNYGLGFGELQIKLKVIPSVNYVKQSSFCKNIRYVVSYADNLFSNSKPYTPTQKIKMIFVAFKYKF